MRVLFTVAGWTGHYYCMVPLGWALQAAGHEVRVVCTPELGDTVARSALTPVPLLHSADLMSIARFAHLLKSAEGRRILPGLPLPLHPTTGRPVTDLGEVDIAALGSALWRDLAAGYRDSGDAVVAYARQWRPDLVCYSLMSEPGPLAARAVGVPAVYACPGFFGAAERGTHLDMGPDDPTGSFVRHGLEPWRREQTEYVIDPSPSEAVPEHGDAVRVPVRYVPYNGTGASPAWLREPASVRRVCLVWGRSATSIFGPRIPALRTSIHAAAEMDVEVVLAAARDQADALGDLPANVRCVPELPFQLVLDTCDAVIHHGSGCTLMTAAVAGVPQLGLPLSDDAIATVDRAAVTGAVVSVPALVAEPEEVRRAVETVLTAPYREAAARLRRDLMSRPTPAQLVPTLERVAGR
jgi:hypothetical protein